MKDPISTTMHRLSFRVFILSCFLYHKIMRWGETERETVNILSFICSKYWQNMILHISHNSCFLTDLLLSHLRGGGGYCQSWFLSQHYYKSSKKDCNGLARNEMQTFFYLPKLLIFILKKKKKKLKSQIVEFNWSNVCANQNAFFPIQKFLNYFIFYFNGHKSYASIITKSDFFFFSFF